MITIKNNYLTVTVNELGAEIQSILCQDEEFLWDGRKEIWSGRAPILFPICGGLKEDKYMFDDKEYNMPKHGYVKNTVFEVESISETKAVFLHKSTEETKKIFPFDYELRVIYSLDGNKISTEYRVSNTGNKSMYFSIGSHEAYYTPEGIEDYDIIFGENVSLDTNMICGNLISPSTMPILKDSNVLPLYEKYFTVDALVFRKNPAKSAMLRNRKTGKTVTVDFPDATSLLIWHKPNSPYICIEPWLGFPDVVGSGYDITEKEGIIPLDSGKTFSNVHTITINRQ